MRERKKIKRYKEKYRDRGREMEKKIMQAIEKEIKIKRKPGKTDIKVFGPTSLKTIQSKKEKIRQKERENELQNDRYIDRQN